VPGRIRDDDIALVRERARIEEVVSAYVTLRNAGGGSEKGLCPFHDEKSPSFHVTPARGFFHCLAGETEVMTWDGPRPIRELAGGTHRILGSRADWVEAPFKSYGIQRLHKITLTRNGQVKELFATDGHRWFVRSGRTRSKRREVLTASLKTGDRLCHVYPRSRIQKTVLLASGENLLVHHLPRFFKSLPDLDESRPYLLGWLAGYFAADGCVAADGTVMLNSARREHLEFVRTLCTRLGIATYGITDQLRAGFPNREPSLIYRVHFVNDDLPADFFLLEQHRERFTTTTKQFTRRGWVVRSVEDTDREEEVFCAEVADGHAFALADNILTGNCFGCGEGGDVISFLQKIEGLGFTDAVERLAEKYGVQLRYAEGGATAPRKDGNLRPRMIEAHKKAAEFYVDQLASPDAVAGRKFLSERGFDKEAADTFGIGFSPRDGDALFKHLRGSGFKDEELVTGGLVAAGQRGHYDRFRSRLMWPIRDTSGDVIGFGARRLFDDDRISAKYINTPDSPIYKKSRVLYGIDLARRDIARASQAVVVEGYTDVMACHLSGVMTAVASCGTAFGEDHARVLQRLLHDQGEVIFTFDGDEAGQGAALKAFGGDQQFVGQTYVAVEPNGMDPCDLRLRSGDAAVRELVARRIPLYRFVLSNVVGRYDLDRADGRVDALREAAKLVSSIRDRSKVDAFARELAGMVGVDMEEARTEVRRAANRGRDDRRPRRTPPSVAPGETGPAQPPLPDLRDPRFSIERETLKLIVQHPLAIGRMAADVDGDDFTHPTYRGVWEAITECGGPSSAPEVAKLVEVAKGDQVVRALHALAVEPLLSAKEPTAAYVAAHVYRLQELTVMHHIAEVKSKLQRTNPVEHATEYNRMFGELIALEQCRRNLRERAIGGQD